MFGNGQHSLALRNPYSRLPISRNLFPFILDAENTKQFGQFKLETPHRHKKIEPKDGIDDRESVFDVLRPLVGAKRGDVVPYKTSSNLWKEVMNGAWTNWGPNRQMKKEAFEVSDPMQIKNDRISFGNEYFYNPLFAEASADAPDYLMELTNPMNLTTHSFKAFSNYIIINSVSLEDKTNVQRV